MFETACLRLFSWACTSDGLPAELQTNEKSKNIPLCAQAMQARSVGQTDQVTLRGFDPHQTKPPTQFQNLLLSPIVAELEEQRSEAQDATDCAGADPWHDPENQASMSHRDIWRNTSELDFAVLEPHSSGLFDELRSILRRDHKSSTSTRILNKPQAWSPNPERKSVGLGLGNSSYSRKYRCRLTEQRSIGPPGSVMQRSSSKITRKLQARIASIQESIRSYH